MVYALLADHDRLVIHASAALLQFTRKLDSLAMHKRRTALLSWAVPRSGLMSGKIDGARKVPIKLGSSPTIRRFPFLLAMSSLALHPKLICASHQYLHDHLTKQNSNAD